MKRNTAGEFIRSESSFRNSETVNMNHIKLHYYGSHRGINPTGIVPKGPDLDFQAPHGRGHAGVQLSA